MWAQLLDQPQHFTLCEVPTPTAADLGPGDVLLRTLAGGLCGSDLPFYRGQRFGDVAQASDPAREQIPGLPMHEVVGEVVASNDPTIGVGQRVVGWAVGFNAIAEFVVTTGAGLQTYDPALSPSIAVLLQPLACVLYAMERLAPLAGRSVAVIGQGPIGVLFSHVAKARGARHVIGVDRVDRSDVATRFGVDELVHGSSDVWSANLARTGRPEVVIEAIGHQAPTLEQAIMAAAPGGQVYYFGVPDDTCCVFPIGTFFRKNLTLTTGLTMDRRRVLAEAGQYLAAHPDLTDGYVTHTLPVSEVQSAFQLATVPTTGQLKVVVEF